VETFVKRPIASIVPFLLAAGAIGAAGPGAAAPSRPRVQERAETHALEREFAERVDAQRLLRTVRELVEIGPRMGGTPSGDAAAEYHEGRLIDAGLAPWIAVDPPKRAFQPLSFSAKASRDEESLDLVDGALALHTRGIEPSTLELRSEPLAEGVSSIAPYALFSEESGPRPASQLPRGRAPRVILLATARRVATSAAVIHQPRGVESTLLTVSKREAEWLRARLAKGPLERSIGAEVFDGEGTPRTVLAEVASKRADAPILLFCAHGDSDAGGPGADDNGSGNAVVLELATVFAELAADAALDLPFTLRFAIWGSEIHSTRAYLDAIRKDGSVKRHLAVVNFDQAGTGAERDCIYFEPDDEAMNEPLVRAGLAMAGDYCGEEGFWSEYTSNAALGGTDSYVFCPQRRRDGPPGGDGGAIVPAITLFSAAFGSAEEPRATPGFRSPGWKGAEDRVRVDYSLVYHESGDRPEHTTELEPWNMEWVTKAAGLLALRLADDEAAVAKLLAR
jgi:hypothetical protein